MPDQSKPPTFTHKGYTAMPEWDADDKAFHGRIANIRDMVTFEGGTLDEARQAFVDSVDDYLAFCDERGVEPGKPEEAYPTPSPPEDFARRRQARRDNFERSQTPEMRREVAERLEGLRGDGKDLSREAQS